MGGLFKVWGVGEGCEPITEASLKEPQFGGLSKPLTLQLHSRRVSLETQTCIPASPIYLGSFGKRACACYGLFVVSQIRGGSKET